MTTLLLSLVSAAIVGAGARAIAPATVTSAVESGLDGAGIGLVAPGSWSERSALLPADHGLFDWLERHGHRFGVAPGPTAELPLIEVAPDGDVPQRPLDPDLTDAGALEVTYPAAGDAVAGRGAVRPLGGDADAAVSGASAPRDHGPAPARRGLTEV